MNTQTLKNFTMTVIMASLPLLSGLSSPLCAGPSRHTVKKNGQTYQTNDKSNGFNLPAPVADDSPINPASTKKDSASGHQKKSDRDKNPNKKRSRH